MRRLLPSLVLALVLPGAGLLVACSEDTPSTRAAAASPASNAPTAPAAPTADVRPVVLFLGDSLTAGYGLDSDDAFPARIQRRIDEAGLSYRVVNAGVSGDTSAGGLRRIAWLLRMPVSVLVLELGGNDMLRGLDPGAMKRNLQQIVRKTRDSNPDARIVIAGMKAPPNLGAVYVEPFEGAYEALAREEEAVLIPFFLEGVAGDPRLNQPDGIHPTVEGHALLADTVWSALEPVLRADPS